MNFEKVRKERGLSFNVTDKEINAMLQVEDRQTAIDKKLKKGVAVCKAD